MKLRNSLQWTATIILTAAAASSGWTLEQHSSLRDYLMSIPQNSSLGGETTRPVATRDAFSFLAANAPKQRQRPFSFGNRLFNTNWVEAPASVTSFDGLGPLFNRVSCSGCHTKDGRAAARIPDTCAADGFLVRLSVNGTSPQGVLPHPHYGEQLNERAINGVKAEPCVKLSFAEQAGTYGDGTSFSLRVPVYSFDGVRNGPSGDFLFSPRVAPAVIGLGLLQSISDATLTDLADPYDRTGDGISGRVNRVPDVQTNFTSIGRFGWKAGQPNLRQQNAAAAVGDIGLTTSLFPNENCTGAREDCKASQSGGAPEISDEFLDKLTLYTQTLAVPKQRNADAPLVRSGQIEFHNMGCASCHLPTLVTDKNLDLPELSEQVIHPFTDLLLHDMGEALADGRPEYDASGREWRTPPLWGIGLYRAVNSHQDLLHDGRARGVAEAILWHGGEAEQSREEFRTAPRHLREALVAFVNSL